jgi:amino-acid N-acetyltransferase
MFQANKEKSGLNSVPVGEIEFATLRAFLKESDLPAEDIRLGGNEFFLYYNRETVIGSGGLEFYGDHCLLRSVAVAREMRGKGLGKGVVDDLVARAKERGARSISLLTETAAGFFEGLGFRKLPRDLAPKEIATSSEFTSVCPVSATFMIKEL